MKALNKTALAQVAGGAEIVDANDNPNTYSTDISSSMDFFLATGGTDSNGVNYMSIGQTGLIVKGYNAWMDLLQ